MMACKTRSTSNVRLTFLPGGPGSAKAQGFAMASDLEDTLASGEQPGLVSAGSKAFQTLRRLSSVFVRMTQALLWRNLTSKLFRPCHQEALIECHALTQFPL